VGRHIENLKEKGVLKRIGGTRGHWKISEQISGQISGQIGLTLRQNKILDLIRNDENISRKDIALELSINESAVGRHLETLKEKGMLKRIGGTRGHWEVAP